MITCCIVLHASVLDSLNIAGIAGGTNRGFGRALTGLRRGAWGNRGRSRAPIPRAQPREHHHHDPKILELAIDNVKAGNISQVAAAKLYGIPQATISNYITGRTVLSRRKQKEYNCMMDETDSAQNMEN